MNLQNVGGYKETRLWGELGKDGNSNSYKNGSSSFDNNGGTRIDVLNEVYNNL
jgi:hypothetical protein